MTTRLYRVLVTGPRNWDDADLIHAALAGRTAIPVRWWTA